MWPKSGNSSISMREVAVSFIRIWPEKRFFEGCSWFKFDNLGLALGPNLNFYTSVVKGLKLKVRKIWELNPTFVKDTGEELVGGLFAVHPPPRHPEKSKITVHCFDKSVTLRNRHMARSKTPFVQRIVLKY